METIEKDDEDYNSAKASIEKRYRCHHFFVQPTKKCVRKADVTLSHSN
jgi:hypothetical protein